LLIARQTDDEMPVLVNNLAAGSRRNGFAGNSAKLFLKTALPPNA